MLASITAPCVLRHDAACCRADWCITACLTLAEPCLLQVRDGQGRKMSKSIGNVVDPVEVISQYGTDALRFTLATGGHPMRSPPPPSAPYKASDA